MSLFPVDHNGREFAFDSERGFVRLGIGLICDERIVSCGRCQNRARPGSSVAVTLAYHGKWKFLCDNRQPATGNRQPTIENAVSNQLLPRRAHIPISPSKTIAPIRPKRALFTRRSRLPEQRHHLNASQDTGWVSRPSSFAQEPR